MPNELRTRGATIAVVVYPNANHALNSKAAPHFNPRPTTIHNCQGEIDLDGGPVDSPYRRSGDHGQGGRSRAQTMHRARRHCRRRPGSGEGAGTSPVSSGRYSCLPGSGEILMHQARVSVKTAHALYAMANPQREYALQPPDLRFDIRSRAVILRAKRSKPGAAGRRPSPLAASSLLPMTMQGRQGLSKQKRPRIAVVGSTNMDLTTTVERMPVWGETVLASHFETSFGGKGANQAVAAAKLGAEVVMVPILATTRWARARSIISTTTGSTRGMSAASRTSRPARRRSSSTKARATTRFSSSRGPTAT